MRREGDARGGEECEGREGRECKGMIGVQVKVGKRGRESRVG